MRHYYNNNWTKVVEMMGTNIDRGLMEYDCILRRNEFGDNKISLPKGDSAKKIIGGILNKYSILIALVSVIIFLISKSYVLLMLWSAIFLCNIALKVYIFIRRYKEIRLLQNINTTEVTVLREGIERVVEADQLVKGDIVIVKKDSFIAADMRIISANNLKVDERSITGDKLLKVKSELKMFNGASALGEITNMLFRGTVIKEGTGVGIVVQTGNGTALGRIMSTLKKNNSKSEFLVIIENNISKIQLMFIIISLITYIVLPGNEIVKRELLSTSIFIVTSLCIPILAYSYWKFVTSDLEKEKIYINNISSIINSDEVKVIFLEKYGSIKEEKLRVEKVFTNEKIISIGEVDIKDINGKRLIDISLINSNIYADDKEIQDDLFSAAYIEFAVKKNINKIEILKNNKLKFRVLQEAEKNALSSVVKTDRGYRTNMRGSLEEVISRCTHILLNGIERPITLEDINHIKLADYSFARDGLLTEAMAYRSFSYEPTREENVESNLVFVGLMALENPYVLGVENDIEELLDQGVLPIIFTDENNISAEMMGRKLGLGACSNEVLSGAELNYMKKDEYYKAISKARIYCKMTPKQKEGVISTFISDNFKVAVEGETIGDLATVSSCNLGIVKDNAPKLLKKLASYCTEKSSIKSFLKMKEYARKQENTLEFTGYMYIKMLMAMLFITFLDYLINESVIFTPVTLIVFNIFYILPALTLAMENQVKVNSKKTSTAVIIYSLIAILTVFVVKEYKEFAVFIVLGLSVCFDLALNLEIKFKNNNRKLLILISSIVFITIGAIILYYYLKVIVSTKLVVEIIGMILINIIMLLIVRKWQC